MHAYENEWFKSDESFSHTSERDSLDENALNNEEIMNEANTNQRAEDKPYYIEPRVATISRYDVVIYNALYIMQKIVIYIYVFLAITVSKVSIFKTILTETHQFIRDTTSSILWGRKLKRQNCSGSINAETND